MAKHPDTWNPDQYDRFRSERTQPFFDLLAMVRQVERPRVVDLGCGTGELTCQMHSKLSARETIGIDSSSAMLGKARLIDEPNLRFELADIATWTDDAPFDVIFSNAAIQWLPDHPVVLRKQHSMLAPRGQLPSQIPANDDHVSHEAARIARAMAVLQGKRILDRA